MFESKFHEIFVHILAFIASVKIRSSKVKVQSEEIGG